MRSIAAASVGDGLCVTVYLAADYRLYIDCGSKDGQMAAWKGFMRLQDFDRELCRQPSQAGFLLSHFHTDHYCGLIKGAKLISARKINPIPLAKVFYPGIPRIIGADEDGKVFYEALFSFAAYSMGDISGSPAYDFINLLNAISASNFEYKPVYQGDLFAIGQSSFKCLWPPKKIDSDEVRSKVDKAVKEYEKACKEIDVLNKIDTLVKQLGFFEKLHKGGTEITKERRERRPGEYSERKTDKLPDVAKSASKLLREAANHLCIAFVEDNRLLFMGDLEPSDIPDALSDFPQDSTKLDFEVFFPPHHGTHWHDGLTRIRSKVIIASNGHLLSPKFDGRLTELSPFVLQLHNTTDVALTSALWTWQH